MPKQFFGLFFLHYWSRYCCCLKNQILGKPKNHDEALEMLLALNGHSCNVISAACLIFQSGEILDLLDMAEVVFHHWSGRNPGKLRP